MTYVDEHGTYVYGQHIRNVGESSSFIGSKHAELFVDNSESLEVSYLHLALSKPILAYFLTDSPAAMLTVFCEVALAAILVYYPNYERIHSEVHVRITDLPLGSSLRDLRTSNLNNLVRVSGVVTRRTGVFPQLKYIKLD
jgi:DNA replication licensing factor MCM2